MTMMKPTLTCLLLILLLSATAAFECGVASTPCQAGCWNPSARVHTDGLRLCEPVSPGYFSPDNDDAQYPCGNTNTTGCEPCTETKQRLFLRGPTTGCSPTPASAETPSTEDKKKNDQIDSLKYVLVFSFLVIGFVYIRARILDCQTRRQKRRPRPIPAPPTDPKPVAAGDDATDRGSVVTTVEENAAVTQVEENVAVTQVIEQV